MAGLTFFQIFLVLDVFVLGALMPLIFRHGYAHFRPEKHDTTEKPRLSPAVKEKMVHNAEVQYQKILERSVGQLQHDLESSSEQINTLVKRFAGDIVNDEMGRYRDELAKLHKQAEADMGGVKQGLATHQAELEKQLAAEMDVERQRLLAQIDTKLGDAVGSFLLETLQHNVDLGNQADYLVAMLEEHKADFKKEVSGEA